MKKITLYFYSAANLGDDLFVKVFSEYFYDYRILLIANPRYIPKNLPKNVRIHPHSYANWLLKKLQSIASSNKKLSTAIQRFNNTCFRKIQDWSNAYVMIGGSLFPDHPHQDHTLSFSASQEPQFSFDSIVRTDGNSFVIGANLGPVYTDDYWQKVHKKMNSYVHVCFRDYASYQKLQDLPHIQYAPDVLFMIPRPDIHPKGEHVVISVIDISNHTHDESIITSYEKLIADTAIYFASNSIPVTMVSYCKWERDEAAIDRILAGIPNVEGISKQCYTGDAQQILDLMASASFIVASRFHSMILAASFGIPMFPISYSCKTEHYLQDLKFNGKYATLKQLPFLQLEDLLSNYHKHVTVNCEMHKKYAHNQFRALQDFLNQT